MFKIPLFFFIFIFIFIFKTQSFATMFNPLPIEKQVEEANSGAEVTLNQSKAFKNQNGQIMTEFKFDVLESFNLEKDSLENSQLVITMLGGTFQGVTATIDGAPNFSKDKRFFLLLKKIESKIYLSNFTLGKYNIQNIEGQDYYVSEVFPFNPNIGRISKNQMIDLMKTKWKLSFNENQQILEGSNTLINSNKTVQNEKKPEFKKRTPADDEKESIVKEEVPVFFWGAIALLLFVFSFIYIKLGNSESE